MSSEAQATQNQLVENVTDSCENGDVNEDNTRDTSEENDNFPLYSGRLEHVAEVTCKSNSKHAGVPVLLNGEKHAFTGRNGDLKMKLIVDSHIKFSDADQSHGIEPIRFTDHRTQSVEIFSDVTIQNFADLSNDFTHTFMLDEELELEQKTLKTLSALNRY